MYTMYSLNLENPRRFRQRSWNIQNVHFEPGKSAPFSPEIYRDYPDLLLFSVAQGIFWLSTVKRLSRSTLHLKDGGEWRMLYSVVLQPRRPASIHIRADRDEIPEGAGPLLILSISLVFTNHASYTRSEKTKPREMRVIPAWVLRVGGVVRIEFKARWRRSYKLLRGTHPRLEGHIFVFCHNPLRGMKYISRTIILPDCRYQGKSPVNLTTDQGPFEQLTLSPIRTPATTPSPGAILFPFLYLLLRSVWWPIASNRGVGYAPLINLREQQCPTSYKTGWRLYSV